MDVTLLFSLLNSLVAAEMCGYFISWESHWNQWQHKSRSFSYIIIVQSIAKKLWFCSGVNGKGTVTLILKWDCLCKCLCVHEWMNTAGMSPSAATSLTNQGYSRLKRQERHETTSINRFSFMERSSSIISNNPELHFSYVGSKGHGLTECIRLGAMTRHPVWA